MRWSCRSSRSTRRPGGGLASATRYRDVTIPSYVRMTPPLLNGNLPNRWGPRRDRSGDVAELAQRAEVVPASPVLGDEVAVEPDDVDLRHPEAASGGREAEEVTDLPGGHRRSVRDTVAVLEHVLDLVPDVGQHRVQVRHDRS